MKSDKEDMLEELDVIKITAVSFRLYNIIYIGNQNQG